MQVQSPMHDTVVVVVVSAVMMVTMICSIVRQGSLIFMIESLTPDPSPKGEGSE